MRCANVLLLAGGLLLAGVLRVPANAADLKDPTRPPILNVPIKHADEHRPLPHVSAIFQSSTRRIAIFDDQPVRAGDRVGAYRIDEVTAHGVRYSTLGHSAFASLQLRAEAPL
jgi:hypothetical protein